MSDGLIKKRGRGRKAIATIPSAALALAVGGQSSDKTEPSAIPLAVGGQGNSGADPPAITFAAIPLAVGGQSNSCADPPAITFAEPILFAELISSEVGAEDIDPPTKKRGRKPKGGKIILNSYLSEPIHIPEPNIILHLKCGEEDLIQNNLLSDSTVSAFQCELNYQIITDSKNIEQTPQYIITHNNNNNNNNNNNTNNTNDDIKIIWEKLKELTYQLHTNNISDKKSACFWCTCDFDNPSIFIPKHELNNTYYCYGCFCSPECATAFLFKESIDTSTRFERYHLLNHIYCKIYDYKKNIKPAPDPYYTLNKYYGNLSIQEYRRLLKNERLLLVVDKPLSRTLPELHEDNDDFIYNGKFIPSSNKFKLRRKNKQSKTDILNDTFNLQQPFAV
jgi:hypothetical protein